MARFPPVCALNEHDAKVADVVFAVDAVQWFVSANPIFPDVIGSA